MIRLELLASFNCTSLVQRAILRLFRHMASHDRYLQLSIAAPCDTWILERARQFGILRHLVITQHSVSSSTLLLFEIFANPNLHTLELNCPVPEMAKAIVANPHLQTLKLYSYEDDRGKTTASLLRSLARRPAALRRLHLYCPKSAIHTIVENGLVFLFSRCPIEDLEISCIRHHQHSPQPFPLAHLQRALRTNQSLRKLGIFHADLTTAQVDQDLLSHLHHHPSLSHLDLFGNDVESLHFPLFLQQIHPCSLQELRLEQNPCWIQTSPASSTIRHLPAVQVSTISSIIQTTNEMHHYIHLFQRHPRLYHFGVNLQALHYVDSKLLHLADANRIGIRSTTLLVVEDFLWPSLLARITQHPTLRFDLSPRCSSPTSAILSNSSSSSPRPTCRSKQDEGQSHHGRDLRIQRQASLLFHLLQTYPTIWMGGRSIQKRSPRNHHDIKK